MSGLIFSNQKPLPKFSPRRKFLNFPNLFSKSKSITASPATSNGQGKKGNFTLSRADRLRHSKIVIPKRRLKKLHYRHLVLASLLLLLWSCYFALKNENKLGLADQNHRVNILL